jgi:hypothetical protein
MSRAVFDQIDQALGIVQAWVKVSSLPPEEREAVHTLCAYVLVHLTNDRAEHERIKSIPRKPKDGESNQR